MNGTIELHFLETILNFYLFSKTTDSGKCSMLLSLLLLNSLKLNVCLYVFDWYLLGIKLSLSHTQIGTFWHLGVQLKFPDEHPRPFYMESPRVSTTANGKNKSETQNSFRTRTV